MFLYLAQFIQLIEQMWKLFIQNRGHPTGFIGGQADDLHDGILAGKAAFFFIQAQATADQIDHIFRVAPVENRKRVGKT